jgi:Serine/threonine protein kinase
LADFYIPNKTYGPKTGTLRYKAPEMLLGYNLLDYSTDIWALGCTFASMVSIKFNYYKT